MTGKSMPQIMEPEIFNPRPSEGALKSPVNPADVSLSISENIPRCQSLFSPNLFQDRFQVVIDGDLSPFLGVGGPVRINKAVSDLSPFQVEDIALSRSGINGKNDNPVQMIFLDDFLDIYPNEAQREP